MSGKKTGFHRCTFCIAVPVRWQTGGTCGFDFPGSLRQIVLERSVPLQNGHRSGTNQAEAPSAQGRSGGQLARQVGTRDEEKRAEGGQGATRVKKSDELSHEADGPNATQSRA